MVQGGTFVMDIDTKQILHYRESEQEERNDDIVNGGIYFISTEIFREFEKESKEVEEEQKVVE